MRSFAVVLGLLGLTNAHLTAWHRGMYCLDGASGQIDLNTADPVTPLYQLPKSDWWFHHINKCDEFPPAPGEFLDLPAGGQFQVEIASNRAKTSLSYSGRDQSDWPDGGHYPDNYNVPSCITSPNMHTQNQSMAAGSAFAISYQSDIKQVTPENLVVFSVRYNTPWKRVARFDVPAAMPACPPEGCICAWGWIPDGCGQANIYHQAYRCRVTNPTSSTPLATPKPPVWCEGHPDKCTKGAKQMLYWNQADGNNIFTDGLNLAGQPKSPGYNMKTGFADGAQNDIFVGPPASNPGSGASPAPPPSHNPSTTPANTKPQTQPTKAASQSRSARSTSVTSEPHNQPPKPTNAPAPHANPANSDPSHVSAPSVQSSTPVATERPSPRCNSRNGKRNNSKRNLHTKSRLRRW
ncbi:hypothetical protein AGABI2DRAFT_190931 [Agaricus bisporus var. bisporus H97]|uniref:hypothetical protein n=1 Tax=Agaricus bisporus var. bisporus (strain H97 / ATCC MYA-4626 / FGSC 10389) TaxID=936046 RepID=UPI00029F7246|nr:hypothetical protein AGABI2DRAFT_190931 [Agaricus bisporus var. bisporus H97]EKV50685.1 hypothetical protein AGABI2DRAFT_190931 [Agaricus bisporus var. bisporus H97]